jgi:hypothetical protein
VVQAIGKATIRCGPVNVPHAGKKRARGRQNAAVSPATHKALLAGALGILLLSAGCATQSGQAREVTRAMTAMRATRVELAQAREQVDDVLGAMDQLRGASAGSLPWVYRVFTDQVSQTVRQSGVVRRRTGRMLALWRQYTARWEKEIDRISTPDLQAGAAERRRTVLQNYERLRDAAGAMEQAYPPFLTQLYDIQKSLSLDLTPPGVRVAQPVFDDAHRSGAELRQRITAFMDRINQVTAVSPPRK